MALDALVESDANLRNTITSIGVPILTAEGKQLLRGPNIRIPEVPGTSEVRMSPSNVDAWANKGWVDLRPVNMERWKRRIEMLAESRVPLQGSGSAAIIREAYIYETIRSGAIVGWIFNNEQGGYRIK
jgi:hypothetical protein